MKNTLNKTITSQFYIDPDNGFNEITKFWKEQIAQGYKPSSYELLSYAILRGKDYRKGFSKVTNQRKLDNGMYEYLGFRKAIGDFYNRKFAPIFDKFINKDANQILKKILPTQCWLGYWGAIFPLEYAYVDVCDFSDNIISQTATIETAGKPQSKLSLFDKMVKLIGVKSNG